MTLIDFDKAQIAADAKTMLIGIDEAGRGPLAGPVTACACYILPELYTHPIMSKINDSKKLTPQKREMIFAELITLPIIYCTGYASAAEIDKVNILQATFMAMRRALAKFKNKNISVLIDGNNCSLICDLSGNAIEFGNTNSHLPSGHATNYSMGLKNISIIKSLH